MFKQGDILEIVNIGYGYPNYDTAAEEINKLYNTSFKFVQEFKIKSGMRCRFIGYTKILKGYPFVDIFGVSYDNKILILSEKAVRLVPILNENINIL